MRPRPHRPLAARRGGFRRHVRAAVYSQPNLTTFGRRTTSFPSSPWSGQRGRARSRPALHRWARPLSAARTRGPPQCTP